MEKFFFYFLGVLAVFAGIVTIASAMNGNADYAAIVDALIGWTLIGMLTIWYLILTILDGGK